MKEKSDLQTFNELVTDYRIPFIRFAFSYVRDWMVAEDFTMEALLYYWEHRLELKSDSKVLAYILSIIKYKCLNHLRQSRIRQKATEELTAIQEWDLQSRIFSLQACEPEELFTEEAQAIVDKCITGLPEQTRRIFIMSRYENKPYKEIARVLGITPKGVDFHISKALKHLRLVLKDYFPVWIIFICFF
jgi:RNA polymerase sigma-70 factor (ECF subfamily)